MTMVEMPSQPLHDAAAAGDLTSVRQWVARGAAVDVRNTAGQTPLLVAVLTVQWTIAVYLLEHGADPYARDERGVSVIDVLEGIRRHRTQNVGMDAFWSGESRIRQ
ncbi:hypothetical protein KPL74_10940 [Bacillus sp. NP157]|nr:hypothetical protein KPL74_10940 [Bacillus sp. NP157]